MQVPTVIPNCCPLLLDSWRHTWTIRQAYSQSHCLMLKMWTQMIEERLNGESTAVILCKSTIIVYLSDDSSVEVWQDSSSSLCEGCAWLQEYDCTSLLHHCKNKWVILTRVVTLVTDNLRDSVYESYSELHKSTQYAAAHFLLQPHYIHHLWRSHYKCKLIISSQMF